MQNSTELFFSYSHRDEALRDELAMHLKSLERRGLISSWHDRRISAGTEWKNEIDRHLKTADIILLLVSAYFLNSDYCWDIELELAMQRHEAGEARVIPVILRPVDWQDTVFGKLQALPRDAKPVTSWADQHEAFADIALNIKAAIEDLFKERQQKGDDLRSAKGVDYTKLRDLLKAQQWKEADYETYLVIRQAVGKQQGSEMQEQDLLNFPCADLRTINDLWIRYSGGRFGFSVQKQLYLNFGGQPDGQDHYREAWEALCSRVEWIVNGESIAYDQLTFTIAAPVGHLPAFCRYSVGWVNGWGGMIFSAL
ncbi:MAG: GUN4 domain-containing protein [Leptolyngbya sp. Prado105]|jgi:hypothetical protein|nr:GUN4 domain-containing protein [Leptolyngbya sp. Prado105]